MRQRILLILALAVTMLALYTFVFRPRPAVQPVFADLRAAGERLQTGVAAEATGAAKAAAPDARVATAPESTAAAPAAVAEPRPPESWGTDPFVRDWVMINELANLSLKAITIGGERSYALINDQILEEGDQISGKRIVRIESDKVTLEQGGRTFTLMLGE